jgi:DNA-binding CsgD family transcriptional regulator
LFFKKKDLEQEEKNKVVVHKFNNIMYISILLNCIYAVLCKGIGKAFMMLAIKKSLINLYPVYYWGAILGCIICFIAYRVIKTNSHVCWNLTFGLFAIAMFIFSVADGVHLFTIFGILMGIVSTMGMINMYYILGLIGKRYWNHLYVKLSILFIGLLGGISGTLFGSFFSNTNELKISISLSIISVIIVIILLMMSPILSNTYYKNEIYDEEKKDKNIKKYRLTKREGELCQLLIDGYTLRQASVMMGIRYYTANGYNKSIYRKMNINSKIELVNLLKNNNN